MIKHTCVIIAAAAMISSAAYSQSLPDDQAVARVRYDDLNLSQPSGVDTLRNRVQLAVRNVCGAGPAAKELARAAAYRECLASAEQSASGQMEAAIAESRTALARR